MEEWHWKVKNKQIQLGAAGLLMNWIRVEPGRPWSGSNLFFFSFVLNLVKSITNRGKFIKIHKKYIWVPKFM